MKKFAKVTGIVLSLPVCLVLLLTVLLYLPPVQNWAVKQVASYASQSTGLDVSVNRVKLVFPLRLGVEGVKVLNRKDTVADIQSVVADVQLMPLFDSQVMVDELNFCKLKVNTTDLIHEVRIKGQVEKLQLQAHGVDWSKEHVNVDDALLANAKLSLEVSDTVPEDTTPSENFWKINIQKLKLTNTDFTLHLPGDTLQVNAFFGNATARTTYLDLYKGLYRVSRLDWQKGRLAYDNNFEKPAAGLDYSHLALSDLSLRADSFYYCDSKIDVQIREAKFREKSGLKAERMVGRFVMDSLRLQLPDLYLKTPESEIKASFAMDLDAFDDYCPGQFTVLADGSVGRSDLLLFIGDALPVEMAKHWPYYPLALKGSAKGNLQSLSFSGVKMNLPTAFSLSADGHVAQLTDMDRLKATANLDATTYRLGMFTCLLDADVNKQFRLPYGMSIKGRVQADGSQYAANLLVTEGKGRLKLEAKVNAKKDARGDIDMNRLAYHARVQATDVQARHFLPQQALYAFTGSVEADGVGTDFLSPRTRLDAKAKVDHVHYDTYRVNNLQATAHMAGGVIDADVNSENELLTGLLRVSALVDTKNINATVVADVRRADLKKWQIVASPMQVSICGNMEVKSDLKEAHTLQASIGDIVLRTKDKTYHPVDVNIDVLTRRDTTHAVANCGDFHLDMDAHGGYQKLLTRLDKLQKHVVQQLKERHIDQVSLRQNFPEGHIYLSTGKENFITRFANYLGYQFKTVEMDFRVSPMSGLNGYLNVDSLVAQGVQLDTIRALVSTDGDTIRYNARIENNKKNPQYTFRAMLDGELEEHGSDVRAKVYDAAGKLGVDVGLCALMQDEGIKVSLTDTHPVLGYKKFTANDSNYVMLGRGGRVSADLLLTAAGGMGVRLISNDENEEALQDLTVSMNNFDLDKVLSVIPYMPDIAGIMNGDFHVVQTKEELSVSSNLTVNNLVYENCAMGNVGSEFVYMPKSDGTHSVDGILFYDGEDVGTIKGSYKSEGEGYLDATVGMNRLPLHFINGFVPKQIVGLEGYGEGQLSVKGSLSKPKVDGEIYLDSAYLNSVPYGVSMRFADDPVRITGSKLLLENFLMYASNGSMLNVQGGMDFSDLDHMRMDVKMKAQNFLLIDAKETARSEAFGKGYVNFFATMTGELSSLKMRGKLDVLGNTDMTYILRDTELETDTQLNELVKFTDFKNPEEAPVARPTLDGFDMLLNVSVDESAHILCALNDEKTNYVDLMGGGDLQLRYNPTDELQLTGKYTLNNGTMKYSLPIIPLTTFTIQDGSYVEFNGDPMNPTLNITATEDIKSTVQDGGTSSLVEFTCGVELTKTLISPGIQFVVSAKNNNNVQEQLNAMSAEDRAKIAVTMLASGMYLADGNTNSFSMNDALTAFLNSEINNITGTAMRSLGLDLGMSVDNSTNASGSVHTDYNFKFSKRFFNNRLSFTLGGQVSSGAQLDNATQNDYFFNNVEVQYRLNQNSSQYIRGFYNNNTYDWLEGVTGEYGVGFTWSRKLQHFSDIFRFKTNSNVPQDTTSTNKTKTENGQNTLQL